MHGRHPAGKCHGAQGRSASRTQDNLLTGVLTDILIKGASHTLLFRPAETATVVELEVPDYALKKLQLQAGDCISIFFKGESLFLL